LQSEFHRGVDRNPHNAGVPVDPAVRPEPLVLLRAQIAQLLAWIRLQPWLGREAVSLRTRERVFRRDARVFTALEVPEEPENQEMNDHRDDQEPRAEAEDTPDVDVARLVMEFFLHVITFNRVSQVGQVGDLPDCGDAAMISEPSSAARRAR